MEVLRVVPFEQAHLDGAAGVLAERQARLRHARPELPAAFTQADACRPLIEAIMARPGAYGVAALRDGSLVGYLAGHPRTEPIWGRAAWSPAEGCALAADLDAERVRDLYAAWAQHFVLGGYFLHYVHAAADEPELMAAWVRTGFGQMQAHALRDLELPPVTATAPRVRRAVPDDIDALEPLLPLIAHQLALPPAFAIRLPEEMSTYRDAWLEELGEPGAHHLLAEDDERPLAIASFYEAEPGPMVPERAWELAVAMTMPEARGRGLMRQLVGAGFAAAREAGATHCITDWRTASLATHRTWTALGFRLTHYRLHRHVDERIAWANR